MTKRLLLLSGLSILIVVLNHAAGYGQVALFLWADRYLSVDTPNWDALGSVAHYVLLIIRSTGIVAVPAFLFISGFFAAYLGQGKAQNSVWNPILQRIVGLLVPYLVWSAVVFVIRALEGDIYEPVEYVVRFVAKGAIEAYYYVPLLCYCYLLSPLIMRAAKERPWILLSALVIIQLIPVVARYLKLAGVDSSVLEWLIRLTPDWSVPRHIFFFALGMVSSLYAKPLKQCIATNKWFLLMVTVGLWVLCIWEGDVRLSIYQTGWFAGINGLFYHFGAVSSILCFLAFDDLVIPFSKAVTKVGRASYGIYLIHLPCIEYLARAIRYFVPKFLAYQVFFVPLLFAVGLFVPLALMAIVNKFSAHRIYRYLFG